MKVLFFILLGLLPLIQPEAATNDAPIKLAILAESAETSAVADVFTAELSKDDQVNLLERADIQKILGEQNVAAVGKTPLQLGKMLGADGLILFNVLRTPQATNLLIRLVAVKPGVVVVNEKAEWPIECLSEWAPGYAKRLQNQFPKLAVLAQDAVPISIVNIRSATDWPEGKETERQLKVLVIQRLSQEHRLFVLERQQMQRLQAEMQLNAEDAAFWNGSYLLEGTLDAMGFDKDKATLAIQLTPPKGGKSVHFDFEFARTNLQEGVSALADKVMTTMQVQSTVQAWQAADEAHKYFTESCWARKWGMYPEAQAAAEAAWALGKRDAACAAALVKAYTDEISWITFPDDSHAYLFAAEKRGSKFLSSDEAPNPRFCDTALYALEFYYNFARTSPEGEPKILPNRENSPSYNLGLEALLAASQVLNHYYLYPESRQPVAQQLASLRSMARQVAGLISQSPTIKACYYVGDHRATHDELAHPLRECPNIFKFTVLWTSFWQEKPEDTLAVYRDLMSSPAFYYIHNSFWLRKKCMPRLVTWTEADKPRMPGLWEGFRRELEVSTNILLQLEAKALAVRNAKNAATMGAAFTNLFEHVFENQEVFCTNNVELLYLNWGFDDLFDCNLEDEYFHCDEVYNTPGEIYSMREELHKIYDSEYSPKLDDLDRIFWINDRPNRFPQANQKIEQSTKRLKPAIGRPSLPPPSFNAKTKPKMPTALFSYKTRTSQPVDKVIAVRKFLPLPTSELVIEDARYICIEAHHWMEDRLVLDFAYQKVFRTFDKLGNMVSALFTSVPAIAIFDPAQEKWNIIDGTYVRGKELNRNYHRTVLLNGILYNSNFQQIRKYDLKKGQWETLRISDEANYSLYGVNGHLYAVNSDIIFEILEQGAKTHILASNRRKPPISVLDVKHLGTATLFTGPDRVLRASIMCDMNDSRIYERCGNDWQELSSAPSWFVLPDVSDEGVLFRKSNTPVRYAYLPVDMPRSDLTNWIQTLEPNNTSLACFSQPLSGRPHVNKPLWTFPSGLDCAKLPVMAHRSNLLVLDDHSELKQTINDQHSLVAEQVIPKDGCNAILYSYAPDLPWPQKVGLLFDAPRGYPPAAALQDPVHIIGSDLPCCWMLRGSNSFYIGTEVFSRAYYGYPPGIWVLPIKDVETELTVQQQQQKELLQRLTADQKEMRKHLMATYDHNHSGTLDPEEKGDALDDPLFIGSELDAIDANHNGWLNVDELAYFDANQNLILEPKEHVGIELAQYFLAERIVRESDDNHDGVLSGPEVNGRLQADLASNATPALLDANHDQRVELDEIEQFYKWQIQREFLVKRDSFRPIHMRAKAPEMREPLDSCNGFKQKLEIFWQHPVSKDRSTPAAL